MQRHICHLGALRGNIAGTMSNALNAAMLREMALQAALAHSLKRASLNEPCRTSESELPAGPTSTRPAAAEEASAAVPVVSAASVEDASLVAAREAQSGSGWTELMINPPMASACDTAAAAVAAGHSVLFLTDLVVPEECSALLAGVEAHMDPTQAITRLPIVGLHNSTQATCDQILLRALEIIDAELPGMSTQLFGEPVAALVRGEQCIQSTELEFNQNEPAINIYNAGGCFNPHKDLHALTVLVPLVDPDVFEGGGTAFWRVPPSDGAYFGMENKWADGKKSTKLVDWLPDAKTVDPELVLRHRAGTALLFGGDVTHAGQPVTAGQRAVFVTSFSRAIVTSCE